jgi:GntR family transcriptional regulator
MAIFDHLIDKTTPVPLYFQLKNIILDEISKGHYHEGDLIPTEKEIGDAFSLSRTTVRQAITELVSEGKLYRIKSKGTFVSKPKLKQDFIKRLETFDETIQRLGMTPSTKLLELKIIKAPDEVASVLRLSEGQKCIFIFRVRYADQEPNVLVRTWLSFDRCQFITQHDLEKESLYRILSRNEDTRIAHINRVMEAMSANMEDARILDIEEGQPIHFFTSIGFNRKEEPIEFSQARYRGDRNRFEVDLYYSEPNHKLI